MKYDSYTESKSSILMLLIAMAAYSVVVIISGHYVRLTGDSTLYLSIAEKYVRGDFSNAINGYWGPLLSWLLVPFLFFGATHLFAINAINLILGLVTMVGIWVLSYRFEMTEIIRSCLFVPLVPVLLFFSLIEPMDLLLLSILVYYLCIVFRNDYPDRLMYGVICGLLGAFAYFSKPYGFPFFISHFILMNVCHYFRSKSRQSKKNVLRNALAGFMIFIMLSGIWISFISYKYDHFTFSNMGKGVFSALGPESKHETLEKGDPIFYDGFFEPPNETAFVIYEDPSYARKPVWSPLKSWNLFKHFAMNIIKNSFEGLKIYESFSRLSASIVIAYILLLFVKPVNTPKVRYEILYPLLTIILYTGGYMPFHFEARYLWIVNVLLLLMGGHVLNELFQRDFFKSNFKKTILTVFFVVSFVVTPLKAYIQIDSYSLNRDMYYLSQQLKGHITKGNIASNREKRSYYSHDSWHKTFRLSYWLNGRYFGQARENMSDEELKRDFVKHDIDYYFFWGDINTAPQFLAGYKEVTEDKIQGLAVYSLKEKRISAQ